MARHDAIHKGQGIEGGRGIRAATGGEAACIPPACSRAGFKGDARPQGGTRGRGTRQSLALSCILYFWNYR